VPGPRSEPGRRSAARRRDRARGAVRRGSTGPAVPPPSTAALTTRAAVLGLVLCALVVSAALPLREWLTQRGVIAQMQQEQAEQTRRVQALEHQRQLLGDPAHVARLARERLHYVLPGETSYVVLDPQAGPAPAQRGPVVAPADPEAPWFTQLWGSVEAADEPTR